MISFTVRLTFNPDDRAEVEQQLVAITTATREEPGCVTYVPHWVEGEPATVLIYEQYTDDAAVDFHRASPHFAQYAIGGFYQKMLERQVENLTAIA